VAEARAVLTVLGVDRIGIVAAVTTALAEMQVNIEDIRMALLDDMFTMIAMVDVGGGLAPFGQIQTTLQAVGDRLGVQVLLQREETFRAMQRV
jgi:ACT domain-containing protein